MPDQSLKTKVAKGAVWTLMEKLSTQIVQFIVGMILARLLTPDDYGTVALTTIFFAIAGVLVDGGFGNALIQKKDADDIDFNSVFYLNLGLSVVAYAVLFFCAPLIADFYHVAELKTIVRMLGICLFFNAVNAIQNAELTKKMLFHLSFRVSLITCFTSAFCGVTLALMGFGVWALVWSSLITGLIGVIARWFIIAWRPRLVFSFQRLKPLYSYGWKMALSSLIDQFFANLNGLLIGKFYTKSDLAYVNKGRSLPCLAMNEVDATLGRVSFPALVLLQDDKIKLRDAMRRMIRCSTFLVFPLMVGIAICSDSLIRLLYGAQWMPAVPYMSFPLTDTATLITLDRPAAVFQMTAIGCEVGGTMLPYLDCTGSNKVSHLRPEGSNMIVTIVVKNDHISHFLLNGDSTILTASDFTPLAADTTYAWCIKDMSPYVPSGSLMTLYNPRGRFQLGILDGSPSGDCSYGYFSDYAKVSYIRLNMDTLYCIGDSIVFDYAAPYVTDLVLTGPNGLRLTSTPFILHNVDTTMTGMYRLEGVDTAGCEELISDSIFIHIQNSSVRLIMDSLFCSGDDISFDFLLDNAANPILQGPNGVEFGSPPFILFDADSTMSGLYRITADDLTGCHYAPADSIRIQILYRYEANIYDTIVENQLPWRRFNTYFYDETDTIIRHGSLSSECDSIFNFHLQVYHHIEDTVLYYTCESDLPVQYDDSLFYQEGLGHFHYTGSHGEDSIVTFILHIIPSSDTTICDSITEDQLPWFALDTVFNDTVADYIYHLFNEAGCDSTIHYSLYIFWNGDHCDTALTYPNVVTPNGDGVNDRFVIGGLIEHNCFKYSELTIYDRYGHCVYHKRNIANESDWWNPAAQRAPSGTYFYYFKAHGVNIWTQHRGVIEVLRDK